ncbi:hypothetical protein K435DRAFT_805387 [Dendrothele bispora CBS 962.96]|uniref:Uncharacterized protein n=1 Tax=Dendrothele bispora (strain CBS 962.96) TaxID=1314807 RepID=A0A4V4HD72_DENBC|nr:hypothetical protein K435DRAFT_805387 [Dendrothele bispora CBS 962.96]
MSLPPEGFSLLPSEITVLVQALQRTPHLTGPEKELLDRFQQCLGENLLIALGAEANGSVPSSSSLPSSGSLSLAQESVGITLEGRQVTGGSVLPRKKGTSGSSKSSPSRKRKKSAYCDPDSDEGNGKKARMARNVDETTEYEETDQIEPRYEAHLGLSLLRIRRRMSAMDFFFPGQSSADTVVAMSKQYRHGSKGLRHHGIITKYMAWLRQGCKSLSKVVTEMRGEDVVERPVYEVETLYRRELVERIRKASQELLESFPQLVWEDEDVRDTGKDHNLRF